jgi:hypothetical protein
MHSIMEDEIFQKDEVDESSHEKLTTNCHSAEAMRFAWVAWESSLERNELLATKNYSRLTRVGTRMKLSTSPEIWIPAGRDAFKTGRKYLM